MDFAPLKRLIDSLAGSMLPGGSAMVFCKNRNVYSYCAGYSDEENGIELSGGELYSSYSMTKPLTAVCALRAVEQGRLGLDTPLEDVLDAFRGLYVCEVDKGGKRIRPAKCKPTVRHLLTMSAGFGESMAELGAGDTLEAVRSLSGKPLMFEAGEHWVYGLCYEVLGAVLEKSYGLKLREVFKKEIFEPCGMRFSCFLGEVNDYSSLVPVYRAKGEGYESAPLDLSYAPSGTYDSGGAGLVTSAGDYERFLIALTSGRLIGPESLSLMTKNHLNGDMAADFNWPQVSGYGYGFGVRTPLQGKTRDYGWGGAAGAYWLYDPALRAGMCFFTNVLGANEALLYPALRGAFYESFGVKAR